MYIPTQFFGQSSCVQLAFTGSNLPDNVQLGQVGSGNDLYFYVQLTNTEATFDIVSGNSNAKLLLIGGGGRSTVFNVNSLNPGNSSAGGGGAGEVIYQDISLAPGRYFMSASAGGVSGSEDGTRSEFVTNYDAPLIEQTKYLARGGFESSTSTGGNTAGNLFTGGTGATGIAGGGGGGSNGNGQDKDGNNGGDGGAGTVIDSPFLDVATFGGGGYPNVAGGGPGDSYGNTKGQLAPDVHPNAYGNGGVGNGQSGGDGKIGAAFLFIPIANCNTGSYTSDFQAEGGDTVDTFISGGVQYKYHIYTDAPLTQGTQRQLFKVTQGYTTEAQTIQIAGGAGSAVSGSTASQNGYRNGGAGAGGLVIQDNVTLWGHNTVVEIGRGGRGDYNASGLQPGFTTTIQHFNLNPFTASYAIGGGQGGTETTNASGSQGSMGGGSGWNTHEAGGTHVVGLENIGTDGGDGKRNGLNTVGAGGGGGGAGSAGSNAPNSFGIGGLGGDGYDLTNTHFSFLTGSFPSGKIGYGGTGGISDGFPPESGSNHSGSVNDGSGANPKTYESGSDGFLAIVYPISGTIENSQV